VGESFILSHRDRAAASLPKLIAATLGRVAYVDCSTQETMPSLQPPSSLGLAILLTVLGVGAAAQPTLPRDRAPVIPGAIRSFVDRLYSDNPKERAEAACQLGRRHAEAVSAIPILLSMLSDDVTVSALECEMSAWLRRTIPISPDARKWMETSPAKEAAEALGDIGEAAVPGLLQALADSDWKVRKFAALGLGEVDQIVERGKVIDALDGRLTDVHPAVRDQSAWALGEIEDVTAVEPLLKALRDSDARVRARVAWALGEIEDAGAVNGLLAALVDNDAAVREKSVWALGEIESDQAVGGLLPLLRDADAKVRRQVAWALGEIESPDAVAGLVQTLTDSDVEVRRQSAWALGEIEHASAVGGLARALKDNDWRVRKTAAWALGEIDDPSAIDELRAAATDSTSEVRRAVAQALRELGGRR
jgi:HEAT repeat protein